MTLLLWSGLACFGPDIGCADDDSDGYEVGRCSGDTESSRADGDATVHPGATELCDGKDNDLDDSIDEGLPDADGDGDPDCSDCDSSNPDIGSGMPEVANGTDDDCDGEVDEGVPTEVWVDSVQDIVRSSEQQTIEVHCVPCGTSPHFHLSRDDDAVAIEVVYAAVSGDTAFLTLEVDERATLGDYQLSWSIGDQVGTVADAARLSRGKVQIDDVSEDLLVNGHDDPVYLTLDGWNFEWGAIVTLADASGHEADCSVDFVEPNQIDCSLPDTQWDLEAGLLTLSVRDPDDDQNCAGYTQDCYNGPVLTD